MWKMKSDITFNCSGNRVISTSGSRNLEHDFYCSSSSSSSSTTSIICPDFKRRFCNSPTRSYYSIRNSLEFHQTVTISNSQRITKSSSRHSRETNLEISGSSRIDLVNTHDRNVKCYSGFLSIGNWTPDFKCPIPHEFTPDRFSSCTIKVNVTQDTST